MHARPPLSPLTPPDYVTDEQNAWRANANAAYTNSALVSARRIKTYQWKFGSTPAAIRAKIQSEPMFAATFANSPVNEAFEKPIARDWLARNLTVQIIEELPLNRDDAWFVTATGEIRKLRAGEEKPSKALNFRWVIGPITYYVLHKYTRQSGGTQDRQLAEEKKILRNFNKSVPPTNHNNVLIVIVDGKYYTDTRMNKLRRLASGSRPRSFAVPIQDVPWAVGLCP